jgi:cyclophilin family peptidyl-prolyl cis-trans isomerase
MALFSGIIGVPFPEFPVRPTFAALFLALPLLAAGPKPKVQFVTSMGAFTVQLEPEAAPKTVENFLKYVRKGFYNGTVFHRVMPSFMVQGGGHLPDLTKKPTEAPVPPESDLAKAKGMTNKRGTVAMALPVGNPFGATAQFFVNVRDNPNLDFKAKNMTEYGYTAFGKVVLGMAVIDKIKAVKTRTVKDMKDVPVTPVLIKEAKEVQ